MQQPKHPTPGATFMMDRSQRFFAFPRTFRTTALDDGPALVRRHALAPGFDLIDELDVAEIADEYLEPPATEAPA